MSLRENNREERNLKFNDDFILDLSIYDYPKILSDFQSYIDFCSKSKNKLFDEITLLKSKILLAIHEEKDIINNRQTRRYSNLEVKEARLVILLQDNEEYNKLIKQHDKCCELYKEYKNHYDYIRRMKNILMVEFQNNNFTCMRQVISHATETTTN